MRINQHVLFWIYPLATSMDASHLEGSGKPEIQDACLLEKEIVCLWFTVGKNRDIA